jgi:glycosyltransferase involved in cell wall biosynthesis
MKTILHSIDTTGPGGAETVFIDLATRLPREDYRSVVVIRGPGWVHDELRRRGVTPVMLDAKGSFNRRYLAALCRLVRDEGVDLIQSHLLGSNVYCSLAGILTRTPVVSTFHGTVDISERERFKGLKVGAIRTGSRHVIAVSEGLRKDIATRTSLRAARVQVIYNGIDTAAFRRPPSDALRRRFGWNEDYFIIGSLGNIRPAKGYDILLRSAARLENSSRTCRFVIAGQGKGQLFDELLQLREELGLVDTVQFLGFTDDAPEFLAGIDLFLSSSISEGLPLSAIQAMVAGLPLLATRVGGYEELVTDRDNGWLVDAGDPGAIAEAIEILAGDPALRATLGDAARRHAVATFDIDTMLSQYRALYDAC